jgi:hypothetical protein
VNSVWRRVIQLSWSHDVRFSWDPRQCEALASAAMPILLVCAFVVTSMRYYCDVTRATRVKTA